MLNAIAVNEPAVEPVLASMKPIARTESARVRTLAGVRGWSDLLFLFVAGVLPFVPLLYNFSLNLWSRPHYQFFPIAFLAAFLLARERLRGFTGWRPGYSLFSILCLASAWVGLLWAALLYSVWGAYLSFLILGAGIVHAFGGNSLLRKMLPIGLLLLLVLPPPFQLDQLLIQRMQFFATRQAGRILDSLEIPHLIEGNIIVVLQKNLFVEEACSGIHSLTSILVVTLIYLIWRQRPWLPSTFVLASAMLWVLAANVLRIVAIAYVQVRHQHDISSGFVHHLFGALLFLTCLGLVLSSDCLAGMFRRPRMPAVPAVQAAESTPYCSGIRTKYRWLIGSLTAFCLVISAHKVLELGSSHNFQGRYPLAIDDALMPVQWASLARPANSVKHSTRSTPISFGDYSSTWSYKSGPWTAQVSIDYPFTRWHDLTICYTATGWQILDQTAQRGEQGSYLQIEMQHLERGKARLYYLLMNRDGKNLETPAIDVMGFLRSRLSLFNQPNDELVGFQVQLLLEGPGELPPALTDEARDLFQHAVQTVRERLPRFRGAQP